MPIPSRTNPYSVIDNDSQELVEKQEAKARTEAISNNKVPFGKAFAEARRNRLAGNGGDTFDYNGKKFLSYQQGDLNAMDAGQFEQLQNAYKWIKRDGANSTPKTEALNAKQEDIDNVNVKYDQFVFGNPNKPKDIPTDTRVQRGDAYNIDTGTRYNANDTSTWAGGAIEDRPEDLLALGQLTKLPKLIGEAGKTVGRAGATGFQKALPKGNVNLDFLDDLAFNSRVTANPIMREEGKNMSQHLKLRELIDDIMPKRTSALDAMEVPRVPSRDLVKYANSRAKDLNRMGVPMDKRELEMMMAERMKYLDEMEVPVQLPKQEMLKRAEERLKYFDGMSRGDIMNMPSGMTDAEYMRYLQSVGGKSF